VYLKSRSRAIRLRSSALLFSATIPSGRCSCSVTRRGAAGKAVYFEEWCFNDVALPMMYGSTLPTVGPLAM
jgi:hypothetical protein